MPTTFETLKELTHNLPPTPTLGDIVRMLGGEVGKPQQEMKIEGVDYESFALFSAPEISVARSFIAKGLAFPEHKHNETEYVLVYSGLVMSRVKGVETIIEQGECLIYEANVPHYAEALEDTWFISMTVPFSKDYPDA